MADVKHVEGAVLHRLSDGVYRLGKKPPPSEWSMVAPPSLQFALNNGVSKFALATAVRACGCIDM